MSSFLNNVRQTFSRPKQARAKIARAGGYSSKMIEAILYKRKKEGEGDTD